MGWFGLGNKHTKWNDTSKQRDKKIKKVLNDSLVKESRMLKENKAKPPEPTGGWFSGKETR